MWKTLSRDWIVRALAAGSLLLLVLFCFEPLRDWFGAIYAVLLGADQGPRFGSFIALYGVEETRKLIADALAGKLLATA